MDQCRAINNICGDDPVACFLGSAQTDRSVRLNALAGTYLVIYTTPETLLMILPELAALHAKKGIGVLAVDEAHW